MIYYFKSESTKYLYTMYNVHYMYNVYCFSVKIKKRVLDWPRAGTPNVFIDTIKLIILINLNVMFFLMRSKELDMRMSTRIVTTNRCYMFTSTRNNISFTFQIPNPVIVK